MVQKGEKRKGGGGEGDLDGLVGEGAHALGAAVVETLRHGTLISLK